MPELTRPPFAPPGLDAWHDRVSRDLKGADFDKKLVHTTVDGLRIEPLYTQPEEDAPSDAAPWTRSGGGWLTWTTHRTQDAEALNAVVLEELSRGVAGVVLQRGGGLFAPTLDQLDRALDGVWLDAAQISHTGPDALFAAPQLTALWQRRDLRPAHGTHFGIDTFRVLATSGTLHAPLSDALQQAMMTALWCVHHKEPRVRAITISNAAWHDAGASDTDDLAALLSAGVAHLRAGEAVGLTPAQTASQLVFEVSVGTDFLREVAKLRALRRLWTRVCEVSDAQAPAVFVATPAARTYSRVDPWVNLLRNTVACFAGALGGADVIVPRPYDARLGEPDAQSRRISRNTVLMLDEESHLSHFVDPAAGSWAIERWTDDLATQAWTAFQALEAEGGLGAALESGSVQERVKQTNSARAKRLRTRKQALTGVSMFPNLHETLPERQTSAPLPEPTASSKPIAYSPGDRGWFGRLVELASTQPLSALREGLSRPGAPNITPLAPTHYGEDFEALRARADAHRAVHGSFPQVFCANLGRLAEHNARTTFSANLLAAGGLEAQTAQSFDSPEAAASALGSAKIAVICSSDSRYETLAESTAAALKAAGASTVWLAGRPRTDAPSVDGYLYLGCDVVEVLSTLWATAGGDA